MTSPVMTAGRDSGGSGPRVAVLRLHDGRALSYAERGAANSVPVFHFHGVGGCRLETPDGVDPDVPKLAGVRLITVDRPGYGESTRRRNRRVVEWAADIAQVADALAIDRFGVSGWSMGGPHALACGYAMPDRVIAIAVFAGVVPNAYDRLADYPPDARLSLRLCRFVPPLASGYQRLGRRMLERDPERWLDRLATGFLCAAPDRELLAGPRGALAAQDVREAGRNGVGGIVDDYRSVIVDWGFTLERLRVPVRWVHGELDATVPLAHAQTTAARIPAAEFVTAEGEGHLLSADHLQSAWSWVAHHAATATPAGT